MSHLSTPQRSDAGDDLAKKATDLVEVAVESLSRPIVEVVRGSTFSDSLPTPAAVSPEIVALTIAKWLASQHNRNTRAAYENDLYDFSEFVANNGGRLSQVTRSTVDVYVSHLNNLGRSPATISRRLATISSFYLFANDEGVSLSGGTNPVARVRRPRRSTESPRLGLDLAEARAVLAIAEASKPRDHALIVLMLMNGLRISEVLSLRIESIEKEAGHTLFSVTTKGGGSARDPLNALTLRAMERAIGDRTEGYVVTTKSGRALDRYHATDVVKRIVKKAGISKNVSPHSLRHTCANLAIESGASPRSVQRLLGHKSLTTTMIYFDRKENLDNHATYSLATYLA